MDLELNELGSDKKISVLAKNLLTVTKYRIIPASTFKLLLTTVFLEPDLTELFG